MCPKWQRYQSVDIVKQESMKRVYLITQYDLDFYLYF
jgi:hypothetical protein